MILHFLDPRPIHIVYTVTSVVYRIYMYAVARGHGLAVYGMVASIYHGCTLHGTHAPYPNRAQQTALPRLFMRAPL